MTTLLTRPRGTRTTRSESGSAGRRLKTFTWAVTSSRPPPIKQRGPELEPVHTSAYLDELETFCREGGGYLDADTYAAPASWAIAHEAAGSGLSVVRELQRRQRGVGFVAARPPGHHATADRAMGFCLFNNIAIAAAELANSGERVLIVDWDVHHGNGTQDIFWNDPRVLYVSTHQSPLYPGTGWAKRSGRPRCASVSRSTSRSPREQPATLFNAHSTR